MQSQPNSSNTPTNIAPRFQSSQNVARTMSSREIADLVNSRHDSVKRTIERLQEKGVVSFSPSVETSHEGAGARPVEVYLVNKRDSFVVVAQLSPEFTAALVDRWQELEGQVSQPRELSRMDLIQLAFEAEQARLQLTIQVEAQATKIHSLENLFKEGMTHTQFCKGLNGVNVMQVGKYLESRNWLYNESKSGLRLRVASYARDKYMTEHQHEVTPHGKEAFISFTPVLLKKGAVRLYDLYLAGELPMKKTWDGQFTHDKALRGAA
ncbi:Rha family transcriptional regulator [Pseudomonas protegens]|uniref:Rha family transcriptional regulator n=1 Tax=Pseudomonas protegens TaxID=380021 RepID=UPI00227E3790|nr:Rha family transcriptional regulator [Pseudomonas protegens]MCY7264274.1 Rha family transcriptional regulator [Pseudomonas protegens]